MTQQIFMHVIPFVEGSTSQDMHVTSNLGRYLTDEEIVRFRLLSHSIRELEGDKSSEARAFLIVQRKRREELGYVVPGDFGIPGMPEDLLGSALYWYTADPGRIEAQNEKRIIAQGGQYNPDDLMLPFDSDDDEVKAACHIIGAVRNALPVSKHSLETARTFLGAARLRFAGLEPLEREAFDNVDRLLSALVDQLEKRDWVVLVES